MKILSFIASFCILSTLFLFSGASAQSTCNTITFNGRAINPFDWGQVSANFNITDYNISSYVAPFTISLCTPVTSQSTDRTGFILQGENPGINYNVFGQQGQYVNNESNEVAVFTYGSNNYTLNQAYVVVHCHMEATTLRPKSHIARSEGAPDGLIYLFIDLEINVLCKDFTTTPAPTFSTLPFTTEYSSTTAGGLGDCSLINLDNNAINPNVWGYISSYANVPQLPGTTAYIIIDICLLNPGFTLTPTSNQTNYIVLSPYDGTFPATGFDSRVRQDVNTFGRFVKWEFLSSSRPQDSMFVYVRCDHYGQPGQLTWFGSTTGSITYYNNTRNGNSYEVHLGTPDLCVLSPTTVAPPVHCRPFINYAGAEIRPDGFPAGQAVFKNVMSGNSVTIFFGTCHERKLPVSNQSIAPGFVILFDANVNQTFPQFSFNSIVESAYFPDLGNVYEIVYATDAVNHTSDRFHLQIGCGGTNSGLSFGEKFILPERNPQGGLTYRVQAKTRKMCGTASSTTIRPPTGTATSGATQTTFPPTGTTVQPPPPTSTTGANKKEHLLKLKNKK